MPRRFRFRHPLVRRAVYEATPGGWRLGAHERCAEALAARGATAAACAHHVERSAREGDLGAVAVLREAGEAAVRLAPASAAHWFAAALRLLPETASAHERVELLLGRADALTGAGHFDDSHSALLDALAIVPEDAHVMRARLARACAGVESVLGRHEQARARLATALEGLPDSESPEAVALMIELALNGLWRTRYDAMRESAERAVATARMLGDAPLAAAALAVRALADSMMGATERAEAERSEAAALVDSLSDDQLAHRLDAAAWLAGAELYLDQYANADAHARRALAVARATGQGELFLILAQTLGGVWRVRGKLAEAGELLDGGIEAARLAGQHAGVGVEPLEPLCRRTHGRGRGARARERSGERRPQPGSRRRLPVGLGGGQARRCLDRDRASGTCGRAAARLRWGRGALAHPRWPEGVLPRALDA